MAPDSSKPSLKLETSQLKSQTMPPPPPGAATPSANPRPILKLNTSRQSSFSADASTPTAERKIKIKVNSSQPSTPAATASASGPAVTKTKAGRPSKPTEKIIEAKKRQFSEVDDDDDENAPMAARKVQKVQKVQKTQKAQKAQKMKIKMRPSHSELPRKAFSVQTPTTGNRLLLKAKGERVDHEPGEAWDSEASDREDDPVREAAMILRTLPGTSTEYLNKAIEEGRIGHPKPPNGNGADLSIDWLDAKERRAMVTIDGHHYAAVLVDLPTVVEAMKTWDRKNFMKNMDITQMLLCFAPVSTEQEAKTVPLPPMVQQAEHKWPHGLTPPMHDAINRRFRKQPSEKQLISAAAQVKKLLADDLNAMETAYEFIQDDEDGYFDSGEEDAEGEEDNVEDYFTNGPAPSQVLDEEDLNAVLEAELEAELAGDLFEEMDGATPGTQLEAQTPMTLDATTPAAVADEEPDEEEEEEEEVSDEDEDDEEDDDELDEEEAAKQAELREIKSEMIGLQKKVTDLESQLAQQTNALMRNRMQNNIQNLKKEIQLRKAKLNITDD